jgi:hypothetical protein
MLFEALGGAVVKVSVVPDTVKSVPFRCTTPLILTTQAFVVVLLASVKAVVDALPVKVSTWAS